MSPYGMIVEKNGDISESEKNYIVSRLYDIFGSSLEPVGKN